MAVGFARTPKTVLALTMPDAYVRSWRDGIPAEQRRLTDYTESSTKGDRSQCRFSPNTAFVLCVGPAGRVFKKMDFKRQTTQRHGLCN